MFNTQDRRANFGLLFMRLGLTAVLLIHSLPKLFDGSPAWESVGTTLNFINIGLPPVFFGLIHVGPGRYAIAVKLEEK